jgi:hypothetical protein
MKRLVDQYGFWFWLHLFLVIIILISPFLFYWPIILVGIIILQVQFRIFHGCLLTMAQFHNKKDVIWIRLYLGKIGFNINRVKLKIFVRYFMPIILISIAIIWQIILKIKPLIF